ncbi:MAG: UDP-N-acetylmuramate dehydrogenase [Sporichthyaceae bacterium]
MESVIATTSVQADVPLGPFTTFRVGGPAARLVEVDNAADVAALTAECDRTGEPLLILAGGSNLLISDDGFAGTVLRLVGKGREVRADGDDVLVTIAAGENWDDFVAWSVAEGLGGIEALSGIPGSAGATPIQNVGAYGQEVADVVTAVDVWDRDARTARTLDPAGCQFAYRDSLFKQTGRYVVTGVTFRLNRGGESAPVRYAELARSLGVQAGETAPVHDVRDTVLGLRRSKGMVLDVADHDTWSAGSFFTNPILSNAIAAAVLPDDAPRYPAGEGLLKTSAAWLIEHAGFGKGYGADLNGGRATLSTKHTLALTNRGTASAGDLVALARAVRAGVLERFGIELHHEPVLVGLTL